MGFLDDYNDLEKIQLAGYAVIIAVCLLFGAAFALSVVGLFFGATPGTGPLKEESAMNLACPGLLALIFLPLTAQHLLRLIGGRQLLLKLDKQSYLSNEPITGIITLNPGKPKKASYLNVRFFGLTYRGRIQVPVYNCTVETSLAKDRIFGRGEQVKFSITMPAEVDDAINGKFADSFGAFPYPRPVKWIIEARLGFEGETGILKMTRVDVRSAKQPLSTE